MSRRVLLVSQPIVGENGIMTRTFQEWQTLVTKLLPIRGSGSPEGVIEAEENQHYYDINGVGGDVLYIKVQDDIGGDRTQGWKLA